MNEVKNIPRLRFPEFSGDFESKIFDDIVNITRLAGYEYSSYWEEDQNEEIIALRGYNIGKGFLNLYNLGYISNELSNQLIRSRLFKNDIVYPCVGSIGNAVVIEENDKYHIQQNIAKITPRGGVYSYFISHFLMSSLGMREVLKFNATSSQPNVLVGSLRKFRINVPSLLEQQKIADFLTAVDKRIELLEKKKTLLETYKKGVMKKIFNQKIRFKDDSGNDFPDWEEKKLGEIGEIVTGKTPSTSNKSYWNGQIQFITPTDIHSGIKYQRDTTRTVTEFKGIKILPVGSIVYTCIASIGKMAITKNPSITNQQINSIITKDINTEFLYYSLQYLTPRIQSLKSTTTLPIINKTEFTGFKIHCPAIIEQVKISKFLSSIDTQLELLETQIDKSKTWKKGLLQKMFV
jgi:type I restriction enzyme S subunit